jgi:hypothetical protein
VNRTRVVSQARQEIGAIGPIGPRKPPSYSAQIASQYAPAILAMIQAGLEKAHRRTAQKSGEPSAPAPELAHIVEFREALELAWPRFIALQELPL